MKTFKIRNQQNQEQRFQHEHKLTSIPGDQEEEVFDKVNNDIELREQHIKMLTSTPGYENISKETANEMVDALLRYATLLYELISIEGKTAIV